MKLIISLSTCMFLILYITMAKVKKHVDYKYVFIIVTLYDNMMLS